MVLIKFLSTHKMGSRYYSEIETYLHGPSELLFIYKNLPNSEKNAKAQILRALCNKFYKKNKQTIYFGPPLIIENEMITHTLIRKTSERLLSIYLLEMYNQNPTDVETINKLNTVIIAKRVKTEVVQISEQMLPIKKRKCN